MINKLKLKEARIKAEAVSQARNLVNEWGIKDDIYTESPYREFIFEVAYKTVDKILEREKQEAVEEAKQEEKERIGHDVSRLIAMNNASKERPVTKEWIERSDVLEIIRK